MITPALMLAATIVAAVLFVLFRVAESRRDVRFFNTTRTVLDAQAIEFWNALVTGGVPLAWREHAAVATHRVTQVAVHLAVAALRAAERPLARLSYKMRVSAPKAGGTQVSEFLKTITPDKSGTSQSSARIV